ncbi:hypothetical protein LBW56_24410, partial [Ralstonia solanacearum]|uniref:hypothetical protein n=1 Tax=Ralstonia solanacearum TaxID=305 RepID=UPI002304F5B2
AWWGWVQELAPGLGAGGVGGFGRGGTFPRFSSSIMWAIPCRIVEALVIRSLFDCRVKKLAP